MVESISIIGLGLIGGSLAKALRQKRPGLKLFALDSSTSSLRLAEQEGVIDRGFAEVCSDICNSDVIFICTPVRKAIDYISVLTGKIKKNCILTDVASTKNEICQYVEALSQPPVFVGGHPMAGTEKSGYSNSFAHLFENAYYVLTPAKTSDAQAISVMKDILKDIGAIPIVVAPEQHDMVTGCISHVPHVIASALVRLAIEKENSEGLVKLLAAGGFKDITRIASSNPAMWENIVLSNSEIVAALLKDYLKIIDSFIEQLHHGDKTAIHDFFNSAKLFRDSFASGTPGLIPLSFELLVDVLDEPGIIGSIATLLGASGINIKNMNVSNSREFEQGCLRITLSDQFNTDKAYDILTKNSYRVFKKD